LVLQGFLIGIGSSNGQNWMDHRRFSGKVLANLGMGKKDVMDSIISDEGGKIIKRYVSSGCYHYAH
jgi:hypothetical protein